METICIFSPSWAEGKDLLSPYFSPNRNVFEMFVYFSNFLIFQNKTWKQEMKQHKIKNNPYSKDLNLHYFLFLILFSQGVSLPSSPLANNAGWNDFSANTVHFWINSVAYLYITVRRAPPYWNIWSWQKFLATAHFPVLNVLNLSFLLFSLCD